MQEEIFYNKSICIWWPQFQFSSELHWGWRLWGSTEGREGDYEAGSCNLGLKSLFLKWLLVTTCPFSSWICGFVSCSGITEGLAVIAVGDQKLLPAASCVSSCKTTSLGEFLLHMLCFPSEDLLAVVCDNIFLYLYFVTSLTTAKRLDLAIPRQMDTCLPPPSAPKSSCWKLSVANFFSGHLHTLSWGLWWVGGGRLCVMSVCSGYSPNGQDENWTKYFGFENSFIKKPTLIYIKRGKKITAWAKMIKLPEAHASCMCSI